MQNNKQNFTAVYTKNNDWFLGWIEEIPGVNTQGKTLEETKENLADALEMILSVNKDLLEKKLAKTRHSIFLREPITIGLRSYEKS